MSGPALGKSNRRVPIGKHVICVNVADMRDELTKGKTYIVEHDNGIMMFVFNDQGDERGYASERFVGIGDGAVLALDEVEA